MEREPAPPVEPGITDHDVAALAPAAGPTFFCPNPSGGRCPKPIPTAE
jgi:hypothetical protein